MLLSILSKIIPSTEREKLAKTIAKIFYATGTALPALLRLAKHVILRFFFFFFFFSLSFSLFLFSLSLFSTFHSSFLFSPLSSHSTDEARVLFRGNTLTTKLIDCYQKLVAKDYLKSILVPTIERVYSLKKALELDPNKVEKGDMVGKNKVLMDKVFFFFFFLFFSLSCCFI